MDYFLLGQAGAILEAATIFQATALNCGYSENGSWFLYRTRWPSNKAVYSTSLKQTVQHLTTTSGRAVGRGH